MASGKREPIGAILANHFVSVDIIGKQSSADAMIESVLALDIDRSKRDVATTIVSLHDFHG